MPPFKSVFYVTKDSSTFSLSLVLINGGFLYNVFSSLSLWMIIGVIFYTCRLNFVALIRYFCCTVGLLFTS